MIQAGFEMGKHLHAANTKKYMMEMSMASWKTDRRRRGSRAY